MDRREFLKASALVTAALATSDLAQANEILQDIPPHHGGGQEGAVLVKKKTCPPSQAGTPNNLKVMKTKTKLFVGAQNYKNISITQKKV